MLLLELQNPPPQAFIPLALNMETSLVTGVALNQYGWQHLSTSQSKQGESAWGVPTQQFILVWETWDTPHSSHAQCGLPVLAIEASHLPVQSTVKAQQPF